MLHCAIQSGIHRIHEHNRELCKAGILLSYSHGFIELDITHLGRLLQCTADVDPRVSVQSAPCVLSAPDEAVARFLRVIVDLCQNKLPSISQRFFSVMSDFCKNRKCICRDTELIPTSMTTQPGFNHAPPWKALGC